VGGLVAGVASDPSSLPFCYLTTTGRVSGAPHRIEIWFALRDGVIYLLSGGGDRSDWVRNLIARPAVELELGQERRSASARLVPPGTEEDALARRLLVEKYAPGYRNDLTEWGRDSLPVAVAWG
jgi:deazaflavin-dependent oxidoreductase (nitroreductase family)